MDKKRILNLVLMLGATILAIASLVVVTKTKPETSAIALLNGEAILLWAYVILNK